MMTYESYHGVLEGMYYEMEDYEICGDEEGSYQVQCRIWDFEKRYEDEHKLWTNE